MQCYDKYPFAKELQFFIGSLILMTSSFFFVFASNSAALARTGKCLVSTCAVVARLLLTLLVLLYPLIATMALRMVHCSTVDGVSVLAVSSAYRCYRGAHLTGKLCQLVREDEGSELELHLRLCRQ